MNGGAGSRGPHRATALGHPVRGQQPLSATVLALLQQLDDLGDALLGDLRGTEASALGTPPGSGSRGGAGAHQGVIEVEGADVIG